MTSKRLILQCRNLGDAIISTGLINSLGQSFPDAVLDIFTRPQFSCIFENNPHIHRIHYADFPMGTTKNFTFRSVWTLLRQIRKLRKENFDSCIDVVGDFRENCICKMIHPKKTISLSWPRSHPYRRLIRKGGFQTPNDYISVPESLHNIYDIMNYVAAQLGCSQPAPPQLYPENPAPVQSKSKIIALHPMASQRCRQWAFDKWISLAGELRKSGFFVRIFCAPREKNLVEDKFAVLLNADTVEVIAETLGRFFEILSGCSLLIGLDSFSIHAAFALHIPRIMLNGANDYRVWAPPGTTVIAKNDVCPDYPCFNKPTCIARKNEYVCINSITVEDVLEAVRIQSMRQPI